MAKDVRKSIQSIKDEIIEAKETFHPYIVVSGPLTAPKKFYVVLETICYEVPTFIAALKLNFEIYAAFKIPYPKHLAMPWFFLQRALFQVKNSAENLGVSLNQALQFVQSETKVNF